MPIREDGHAGNKAVSRQSNQLKLQLQTELNLARIVGAGDTPKTRSGIGVEDPVRQPKIRVIDEVEGFSAKFQGRTFTPERNVALQRKIEINRSGRIHHVSARVPVGEWGGQGESGSVEPTIHSSPGIEIRVADHVRALGRSIAVIRLVNSAQVDSKWGSALRGKNGRDLPVRSQ